MEIIKAFNLVEISRVFYNHLVTLTERNGNEVLTQETRDSMRADYQSGEMAQIGFPVTGGVFDDILALADDPTATYGRFAELIRAVLRAYEIECASITLAYLDRTQAALYEDTEPFGDRVAKAFPTAAYDIEEATKCLALDRFTACVYHLMRVDETALKVIAKRVGLVNDIPGWEECITFIEGQVNKNYAEMSSLFKGDVEFLSGVASWMRDVNKAWRRRVAHIEKEYSEEDARRIWQATKSLMEHMAEKLSGVDAE